MVDPLRAIADFARELKRRKVYRVGVGYVLISMGALELIDVLLPATRLPAWADELLLALAIVGLPLVLVMAWMFDMTPTGVERTGDAAVPTDTVVGPEAAMDPTGLPGEPPGEPTAPAERPGAAGHEPDPRSLAVLPFQNLSGTAEAAPFAAGLHDDLVTDLSRIRSLTVISRTSVMGYRDTTKAVSEIARELGVGTVIEGGVQQVGDRVRLNVQLIDAVRDAHLWAERYDRKLTTSSIFDIQSELAERIASTLQAELTPGELSRTGRLPTGNLEAYRLCAEGRSLLDQRTEEEVLTAFGSFRQAIRRDPDYGLAWAGMATALGLIDVYDYPLPDGAPDPLHAATRGVELAPESGEAHTALGIVRSRRYEGREALQAFERAIEVSPNHAEAHVWLGWLHLRRGRPEEAKMRSERGLELSPLSPPAHAFLADTLVAAGDAPGALREAREARNLRPGYILAHFVEALSLYHMDRFGEARSVLEEALPSAAAGGSPSRAEIRAALVLARVAGGEKGGSGGARALLEEIRADGESFSVGLALAGLGEDEAAWRAFRRVESWDSFAVEQLRYLYPDVLGRFRGDPAWEEIVRAAERSWGLI